MKKIFLLFAWAILLFAAGCTEDRGNYDYRELVYATFGDLPQQKVIEQMSTLEIDPEVKYSMEGYTDDDFEFLWTTGPIMDWGFVIDGAVSQIDTISREKKLDVTVYNIPGLYRLTFKVTDKSTGLYSSVHTDFQVINGESIGYAILCDIDGYAELAFVTESGKVKRNVFEGVNGKKAGTDPIGLHFTQGIMLTKTFWILCNDHSGGSVVSPLDFSEFRSVRDMMYFPTEPMNVQAMSCEGIVIYETMVNNGAVYSRDAAWLNPLQEFGAPVAGDYYASKFIFSDALARLIIYDEKNKRFVRMTGIQDPKMAAFDDPEEDAIFDHRNIGMDILEGRFCGGMGYGDDNLARAILKDPSGDISLLSFRSSGSTITPQAKRNISSHPGAKEATAFAIKRSGDFAYYGYGNKIGISSFIEGNHIETVSDAIPSGLTIDCMRIDRVHNRNELWVTANDGTGSPNSGSLFVFSTASDGKLTKKFEYLNCCGPVVDVIYKN